MTQVMTREEAANFLRVSVRTLDRLGIIRSYVGRLPRYTMEDLNAYLKNTKTAPEKIKAVNIIMPKIGISQKRKGPASRNWLQQRLQALKAS